MAGERIRALASQPAPRRLTDEAAPLIAWASEQNIRACVGPGLDGSNAGRCEVYWDGGKSGWHGSFMAALREGKRVFDSETHEPEPVEFGIGDTVMLTLNPGGEAVVVGVDKETVHVVWKDGTESGGDADRFTLLFKHGEQRPGVRDAS